MNELQRIERDIMSLEVDFKPRASTAYKKKWHIQIEELRERYNKA